MAATSTIDTVVSLCKRRGFVFPCGEIYGGTRSAWDYGPLGVELKDNIKRQWWKSMVQQRDDVVGLDSSVILPTRTWEASGHVATFSDPLTECQSCHHRFRADHLQEAVAEKKNKSGKAEAVDPDTIELATIACPNCGTRGAWTDSRGTGPARLFRHNSVEVDMEERKTTVEKRTEITREEREPKVTPKTTNVNVGSDGTTQVQEEQEIVDDPVGSTIIRQEETVEKHQR